MKTTRRFLMAAISMALALTFLACGDGGGGGGGGYDDTDSSSSVVGGAGSSSSITGGSSSSVASSSSSVVSGNGSSSSNNASGGFTGEYGSLTDGRDGKTYKTVLIGEQNWMAENLNFNEGQISSGRGSRCYNERESNCNIFGRLYEWDDAIKICPDGWKLPTKTEWDDLISHVGSTPGKKLKAESDEWGNNYGTDNYGFGALPGGGWAEQLPDRFGHIKERGYWWTDTEGNDEFGFSKIIEAGDGIAEENYYYTSGGHLIPYKTNRFSVRCIEGTSSRDFTIPYGDTLVDVRDGKKYPTVKFKIVNTEEIWMAENLNFNTETDDSKCYNDNLANCEKYGRLYNWDTAKNICPTGWHLPTKTEWDNVINSLNGAAGKKLKARSNEWGDNYGTDNYGFRALPSGAWAAELPDRFGQIRERGYWWTATEGNDEFGFSKIIEAGDGIAEENYYYTSGGHLIPYKTNFFSVRCVKN